MTTPKITLTLPPKGEPLPVTGESKHTPGPWRLAEPRNQEGTDFWTPIQTERFAFDFITPRICPLAEHRANAKLIAASPDLLRECINALRIAEDQIHDQYDGTTLAEPMLENLNSVRAAIEKATK